MTAHVFPFLSSSSGGIHHVTVVFDDDGKIAVNCSCPGAQMATFCKHREAIVRGDGSAIATDEHRDIFAAVYAAMQPTGLADAYRDYLVAIDAADREKKEITARTTEFKKTFARMLSSGI